MTVLEGEKLWAPSTEFLRSSNMAAFMTWLAENEAQEFSDYTSLWQWSVESPEAFWGAIWNYFDICSDQPFSQIMSSRSMTPGVSWFQGSRVNFAEHILRHGGDSSAITSMAEDGEIHKLSWDELASKVRRVASYLRTMGVQPGDAVSAILPNRPETVVAMLATISVGAIWSIAAPEFGRQAIVDRLGQVKPRLMFIADGYRFGGSDFDRTGLVTEILTDLPSVENLVILDFIGLSERYEASIPTHTWGAVVAQDDPGPKAFEFERVENDHPLWYVFSSGTTGLPKAIAHSHIGVLVEMLKFMSLHMNLKPGDASFFYTTTGWVMFNLVVGMLLSGAGIILYDGHPAYPAADVLWALADRSGATHFGASPTYVQLMEKQGVVPKSSYGLERLNTILVGGSPSLPTTFNWFYQNVKQDLWVTSQSGGTEIASAFVAATPTQPVYAAEIQARALGMSVYCSDDSGTQRLTGEVGELVCDLPFPSMPLYFLGDESGERYQESYFADFPGLWRHGDFIKINERGGCYIYGRSDATLNRYGVRIGTSEIYKAVESIESVEDSLIVCIEQPDGNFFMPLFIQLSPEQELTENFRNQINDILRKNCSPRHVPDEIHQVPDIPYTLTGKKLEVPVRKILMGADPEKVLSTGSMKNPDAMGYYLQFANAMKQG